MPDLFYDEFAEEQYVYGSDSFNRADSASSLGALDGGEKAGTAYEMTGNAVYGIDTNRARYFSGTGQAVHDYGTPDVELQLTSVVHAAGRLITFRYIDENNNFILYESASADYLIRRIVGGSISTVATFTTTAADNDVLKVVLFGSSIQVFVNGVRQINITDTNHQTATKHGLSLNGTTNRVDAWSCKAIVPNPAKWTKVDTESKFSQALGLGSFSGGRASPGYGDPALTSVQSFVRRAGLCAEFDVVSVTATSANIVFGLSPSASPNTSTGGNQSLLGLLATANIAVMYDGSPSTAAAAFAATTRYKLKVIFGTWDVANRQVSSTGFTAYIQGGSFATIDSGQWTLLGRVALGTNSPLYATYNNRNGGSDLGSVCVYRHPFPMPKVYDSMVRADGAIGSAESGQAYTNVQGTAAITSNEGYFSSDTHADRWEIDSGVGDGIFSLDVKGDVDPAASGLRIPGLTIRGDGSTFLYERLGNDNKVQLYKAEPSLTLLAEAAIAEPSDNTYYTLSALAIGTAVKVFVNGALYVSHTLAGGDATAFPNTKTRVGSRLNKSGSPATAARFKNLLVQSGLGV